MDKFHNLKAYPHGLGGGGGVTPKDIGARSFNYAKENDYFKILIGQLWGKRGVGGWLPSNLFGHLKRALKLSISVQIHPPRIF